MLSAKKLSAKDEIVRSCEKEIKNNENHRKELEQVNSQLRSENAALKEDKNQIQLLLQRKLEEFSDFHIQVQQQIHQLKIDNDELVRSVTKKLHQQYQADIISLQRQTQNLKDKHANSMKQITQDVQDLEAQFNNDINHLTQLNQNDLHQ